MYTTNELEKYITAQIESKLGSVDWTNVNFTQGNKNSVEGTYIFSKDNAYHILFAEKGKIRDEKVTTDEKKIIYSVLDIVSFDIAMKFAISNREKHKDFRRKLFEKEVEIYSLFGDDFEKNKKREIEEILEENPYKDI